MHHWAFSRVAGLGSLDASSTSSPRAVQRMSTDISKHPKMLGMTGVGAPNSPNPIDYHYFQFKKKTNYNLSFSYLKFPILGILSIMLNNEINKLFNIDILERGFYLESYCERPETQRDPSLPLHEHKWKLNTEQFPNTIIFVYTNCHPPSLLRFKLLEMLVTLCNRGNSS